MTRRARNFPKIQEIEINELSIKGIAEDKSDARPSACVVANKRPPGTGSKPILGG